MWALKAILHHGTLTLDYCIRAYTARVLLLQSRFHHGICDDHQAMRLYSERYHMNHYSPAWCSSHERFFVVSHISTKPRDVCTVHHPLC